MVVQGLERSWRAKHSKEASTLIVLDINEAGLESTKSEFVGFNKKIFTYRLDLSGFEQIKTIAQKIKTDVSVINILINNAGIVVEKYFHEHTHSDIQRSMLINSNALMYLTPELLCTK